MPATGRLLLRGGRLVDVAPGTGGLRVREADLLVDDGRIRDVAPGLRAEDAGTIDCAGALVLPGFVDTHRHTWQTQLRGVAADWSLFDYFARMRSIFGACYDAADVWLGNHVGALEALSAGVTTLVDHCHVLNSPEHADAALDGLASAGIRAVFCYGLFPNATRPGFAPEANGHWRAADAARVRRERLASDDGLVRFGLAPSELEAMPFDAIAQELALARELGAVRISCHVAMGAWDRGRRLVAWMAGQGLLRSDLLLVHGASLGDDELALVAGAGAAISSTPETELQMAMGRPVAWRARERGIATGLGVDIVSNYAGDLFAPMRIALQAERGFRNEAHVEAVRRKAGGPPRAISPRACEALELGTVGGARAAGLAGVVGQLSPGFAADLVVLRSDGIHSHPARDPAATAVLYANAADVDTVLVAGRVVKRGGVLVGVDWPRLRERLAGSAARILERASTAPVEQIEAFAARLML